MIRAADLRDSVVNVHLDARSYQKWNPRDTTARTVTIAAATIEITIPASALIDLARAAQRNKTGRATAAGLVAKRRR